jgi:membrane protein
MAKDSSAKFKRLQEEAEAFLDERRIACATEQQLTRFRTFVHFWMLVGRSFVRNRCPVRASALAYTTLLALIPLLAVGIGVSASFLKSQGEEPVRELINNLVDQVAPQLGLIPASGEEGKDQRAQVAKNISNFIANVHSGTLGLTGTLALVFVAIGLLSTIEATFNDIWGVARGRSWFARIVQYWAAITLGPLMMILAFGLIVGGQVEGVNAKITTTVPVVGEWLVAGLAVVAPFLILTSAFVLIYMLMPNTKVHWKAALVGGLVGGLLWNLNSQFNVLFAARVVRESKIYGPLSAVPVFLIGMYFSWLILLFGAQVAYAFQNRRLYLQEKQAEMVNQRGREFVALRLMTFVGQRFQRGGPPPTVTAMATELTVPSRLIQQLMQTLTAARLVVEVAGAESAYLPARPLETITCHDILEAMRASQGQELATRDDPSRTEVYGEFQRIQQAEQNAASAVTMLALANRATALIEHSQPPAKAALAHTNQSP